MSEYVIFSEGRETVCHYVGEQSFDLFILDVHKNRHLFKRKNVYLDDVILTLTTHNVPIPRSFRSTLLSDIITSYRQKIIYYFVEGQETARKIERV